ncbi:MAG TPA: ribosome silencing factor [Methylococcaceae bacterium]|jgi:ribosome-associated protein|nr:ribosome silencing factor [Methylococcaceae bacterium]
MQNNELLTIILAALDDGKGRDIRVIDVRNKTGVTDYMIVASGTSERHVKSLADHVVEKAKASEVQPLGIEGQATGEWVLVDLGDAIVHVMKPQVREFYQLEKFWQSDYASTPAAAAASR